MAYAILRTKKLKTMGAIAGSAKHTYREQPTPNADPERLDKNAHWGAESSNELLGKFRKAMPEKVRKNAVIAVEYLITASPERFNDNGFNVNTFFNDSIKWLRERHGAENVMAASVHMDEKTPHLVAYIIPKDDKGKLNCRAFLGGRSKLSAMQTDFAKRVGKKHGLKRGIKGSKAKHKTIKQFYTELNQAAADGAKNRPRFKDKFLAGLGFTTKRMESFNESAQLAAAAALEAKLDSQRAKKQVDVAEQELARVKEEFASKEEQLKARETALLEEKAELHELAEPIRAQLDQASEQLQGYNEIKQQLEAAETLSKRLEQKLEETQRELYEERLNNRSDHNMGPSAP